MEPAIKLRMGTLVLGILVIGIGCHAYFESEFNKRNKDPEYHSLFSLPFLAMKSPPYSYEDKERPPKSFEGYFIAITIIAFILSFSLLAASFFIKNDLLKLVDPYYHVITGLLQLLGASLMIASAVQIYNLYRETKGAGPAGRNDIDYFDEKMAAGVICILNSLLYIFIGAVDFKNKK